MKNEKTPCQICEATKSGEERNCLKCIFGEFTEKETCHRHECKYQCEDCCLINAYERCVMCK